MISFIKTWCEGILVAVMLSILIESLLPEGKQKKYVKVVIGIYILFVVLNPILEHLDAEIHFEDIFKMDEIEASVNLDNHIKDVYITGIEESLKQDLEDKGYSVYEVKFEVDNYYEKIQKITIRLENKTSNNIKIETVKPIEIGNTMENTSFLQDNIELKKYISETYQIDMENIIILTK